MKIIPHFDFNKYDIALGFIIRIENESKKYIRKYETINCMFGIMLLWFAIGIEIKIGEKYGKNTRVADRNILSKR